jgi:uncharacterized heparinase superfamily protein
MSLQKRLRNLRMGWAKLPSLRSSVPEAPAVAIRDPWPGDANRGTRLLRGEYAYAGVVRKLDTGEWGPGQGGDTLLALIHNFTWIRDLRVIGDANARLQTRELIFDWLEICERHAIASRPDVAGARITAWLAHWDFFAASADDDFRNAVMWKIVTDARLLAAALPAEEKDGRALTAIKGLIAASVALPEHANYLTRGLRFLPQEIARQVLEDGGHIERSPAAHLAALRDLIEMRLMLQAAGAAVPGELGHAIDRMAAALRALCHAGGTLALFNGTRDEPMRAADQVLAQAGRTVRTPISLRRMGFERIAAGRTVLIMDTGMPAPPGVDRFAHAGTLAFELSIGNERLIVNCGAAPPGFNAWAEAARATAAHSTLVIADTSSSEVKPHGLGRRPQKVLVERNEANGAHWLEASHDGWKKPFGAIHHRRIYVAESGEDIRGEDEVEAATPQPFVIRFHLHPGVIANMQQDQEGVLLRLPSGGWRLRAEGAKITLDESIFLAGPEARRAEQVVLTVPQDGPQKVKWAISKVG